MSSKSSLTFVLVGCLTLSAMFLRPAKSKQTAVPVWIIKQSSYNLGPVEIVLGKDAFKLRNTKLGITLYMHAPDWSLNAFNESNKKYLVLNKEEALEIFQHQKRKKSDQPFMSPIKLGDRPPVAGSPTIAYCYPHNIQDHSEKFALEVTNATDKDAKLTAEQKKYVDNALSHQRREYWLSKEIVVSPSVSNLFLDNVVSTKYTYNFPLRLVQVGRDGSKTTMFDTAEIRKTTVKPDTFKPPTGYTKAANKVALLINDDFEGFAGEPEPSPVSTKGVLKKNDNSIR